MKICPQSHTKVVPREDKLFADRGMRIIDKKVLIAGEDSGQEHDTSAEQTGDIILATHPVNTSSSSVLKFRSNSIKRK